MNKRLTPVPEGQVERGTPPVIQDESQDVPPTPPPPPAQPEASAPPVDHVNVTDPGTPPTPPPPPDEIEEVASVLNSAGSLTKEAVDAAFISLSRRCSVKEAELKRMRDGLVRLRDIAATTKTTRLACFGQFDASAAFCTASCRDPVCPAYTDQIRSSRLKSLAPELRRQVERMGETEETFGKHRATPIEGMSDGTPITVD